MAPELALRYAGAYGRDGPPSQRAVKHMKRAYYPAPPRAVFADPRPLYNPDRTAAPSARASPPPSYSDAGHGLHNVSLQPPHAAVVEAPKSPRSPHAWPFTPSSPYSTEAKYEYGPLVYGHEQTPSGLSRSAQLMALSNIGDMAKHREMGTTSVWLEKQKGKHRGCVLYIWCLIVLLLGTIAGVIVWSRIHSSHTPQSSDQQPAILSWANGPPMSTPASVSVPTTPTSSRARKRHIGHAH